MKPKSKKHAYFDFKVVKRRKDENLGKVRRKKREKRIIRL